MRVRRAFFPETEYDLAAILRVNQKNADYLSGAIDPFGEGIRNMATCALREIRRDVDGFCGGYGTGFPYHSSGKNHQVIKDQPEFTRYTGELSNLIRREMAVRALWPCPSCQLGADFTPSQCVDCNITPLKPRTIIKVMPDMDTFVICDENDKKTRDAIWSVAQDKGFTQSDFNTNESLTRIEGALDAWAEGRKPASYLPIDLHVIDKNDFIQACADIGDGKLTHPTRWSMYAEWKNNKSIDFWFDFVFSMTPYPRVTDTEILDAIDEARSRLTRCYSVDQLVDIVMKQSYRARQLLQYEPTMEALREKLSSWQQI